MKRYTFEGELLTCWRANNSVNGNPRYVINVANDRGCVQGVTKSDAMFAFNMPSTGTQVRATYHVTRRGNHIIDNIEELT